jgi:hypothetical protein
MIIPNLRDLEIIIINNHKNINRKKEEKKKEIEKRKVTKTSRKTIQIKVIYRKRNQIKK